MKRREFLACTAGAAAAAAVGAPEELKGYPIEVFDPSTGGVVETHWYVLSRAMLEKFYAGDEDGAQPIPADAKRVVEVVDVKGCTLTVRSLRGE